MLGEPSTLDGRRIGFDYKSSIVGIFVFRNVGKIIFKDNVFMSVLITILMITEKQKLVKNLFNGPKCFQKK